MSVFEKTVLNHPETHVELLNSYHLIPKTVRNNSSKRVKFLENSKLDSYIQAKNKQMFSQRSISPKNVVRDSVLCNEFHYLQDSFKAGERNFCRDCLKEAVNSQISLNRKRVISGSFKVKINESLLSLSQADLEAIFKLSLPQIYDQIKIKFCDICDSSSEQSKILKMPECACNICVSCLARRIMGATDNKVILNTAEIKTLMHSELIECNCGKQIEHRKLSPLVFPDYKELEHESMKRFIFEIENHCFICKKKLEDDLAKFEISEMIHRVCYSCNKNIEQMYRRDEDILLDCSYCKESRHNLTLLLRMIKRKRKIKGNSCGCTVF